MTLVTSHLAISLDGYVAGPDQSEEHPLGVGGAKLHGWHMGSEDPVDQRHSAAILDGVGAHVMGRNMFGPVRGPWTGDWRGWWGDEPPYHAPVFVLTHHAREPLVMAGGTTFTFVTEGFDAALAKAKAAAGDRDVAIAGGASTVRQALRAGALDVLHLHTAPVVLGAGERLFDDVGAPALVQEAAEASSTALHARYRVVRG